MEFTFSEESAPLLADAVPGIEQWIRDAVERHLESPLTSWIRDTSLLETLLTQLPELRMVSPCGCHDSFCGSFYAMLPQPGGWLSQANGGRTVPLEGDNLIVRLLHGRIAKVEILFRPALREKVYAVFGRSP